MLFVFVPLQVGEALETFQTTFLFFINRHSKEFNFLRIKRRLLVFKLKLRN